MAQTRARERMSRGHSRVGRKEAGNAMDASLKHGCQAEGTGVRGHCATCARWKSRRTKIAWLGFTLFFAPPRSTLPDFRLAKWGPQTASHSVRDACGEKSAALPCFSGCRDDGDGVLVVPHPPGSLAPVAALARTRATASLPTPRSWRTQLRLRSRISWPTRLRQRSILVRAGNWLAPLVPLFW